MFLPNTDSFVLVRRTIVKSSFPVFLPNTDSFVLIRRSVVRPGFTPTPVLEDTGVGDPEQLKVNDQKKRNFLKVAGVVGAGIIASQLSPKKASALIMGSSPTTGVVGVKNAANARINPATEETVSAIASKTSDLTFDTGSLQVKVTSLPTDPLQVDVVSSELPTAASTETTLETVSFGGVQFALRLATDTGDSNIDYVGEAAVGTLNSEGGWRIKRINSTSGIVIEWANGTEGFDVSHIWNNRESLTYS